MAIEVREVSKRFGDFVALDSVSLTVESGGLVALLGPRGSGKSTLLRVIAGLERPDSGTLRTNGAGARGRAGGPPPGRAVRRARRARARGAARVAPAPARRGARDDGLRHARPGGGDGDLRRDRRRQPRAHRADGGAACALRGAGE